jgi:predicted HD phosphohydrolase
MIQDETDTPCESEDAAAHAPHDRVRQQIVGEAARTVSRGTDTRRAVFRAARRVTHGWVPDDQLPDHADVRREVHRCLDPSGSLLPLLGDRFDQLAALVAVLETVRQDIARHPEGNALEHSLQVFAIVHDEQPCDEELLTAALVHDVGLAIDRRNAIAAGLDALESFVTPRTAWLIENLPAARGYADGTLGHRARKRLEAHPDFLDALLLAEADRRGRVRGGNAPSLEEAIAILRDLDHDADIDTAPGAD